MPYWSNSKFATLLCLFTGLTLFLFSFLRAINVSFTIDESQTYLEFVSSSWWEIISFKEASANNHMLNTLLMKLFELFFGASELSLRLPNVLAHAAYLCLSYLVLRRVCDNVWLTACGFVLLNSNPFLLDHFSIARGYGLSLAFMMAGIYCAVLFLQGNRAKNCAWSFVWGTLAVLSNFSLLPYFASLLLIFNLIFIARSSSLSQWMRYNAWPLVLSFFLLIIVYEPIRKLVKFGALYDGGQQGIWTDTVNSLIEASLYGRSYGGVFGGIVIALTVLVLLLQLGILINEWRRNGRKGWEHPNTLVFLLLMSPVVCSVLQHLLLNTNYPTNRMALFYIPLFFLNFILAIQYLVKKQTKGLFMFSCSIVAAVFALHTVNAVNLRSTHLWGFNSDTKAMLRDIEQHKRAGNEKTELGLNWMLKNPVLFYIKTKKIDWLHVKDLDVENTACDLYYLYDADHHLMDNNTKQVLKNYPKSGTVLLKD